MAPRSFGSRVTRFSAYARPDSAFTRQTTAGAVVTLLGALLALILLIHETRAYFSNQRVTSMGVDLERRHDLTIHLDITLPSVPCAVLSVAILDMAGTAESDVSHGKGMDLHKIRIDSRGHKAWVGGEYATPQTQSIRDTPSGQAVLKLDMAAAMQHIREMQTEIKAHEGCQLRGSLTARRVAGCVR